MRTPYKVKNSQRKEARYEYLANKDIIRIEEEIKLQMRFVRDTAKGTLNAIHQNKSKEELERGIDAQITYAKILFENPTINKSETKRKLVGDIVTRHIGALESIKGQLSTNTYTQLLSRVEATIRGLEEEVLHDLNIELTRVEQARRDLEAA